MPSRSRLPRSLGFVIGVFALCVAVWVIVALWRPWATSLVGANPTAPAARPTATAAPATLALPDHPRTLVFGDSWTVGEVASTPEGGYAYLLREVAGWDTVVDGASGSGYLRYGIGGPPYPVRMQSLDAKADYDLIILQGSINDGGENLTGYDAAVTLAWDRLAATYPETPVVVLGPANQFVPVPPVQRILDEHLAVLAANRGWWYVSPITDEWITAENYDTVIDTSPAGANHPSDAGHRYLAEKVAAAIASLRSPAESSR